MSSIRASVLVAAALSSPAGPVTSVDGVEPAVAFIVATGAAFLEVYVNGETEPRTAQVLGQDECSDLAVLQESLGLNGQAIVPPPRKLAAGKPVSGPHCGQFGGAGGGLAGRGAVGGSVLNRGGG